VAIDAFGMQQPWQVIRYIRDNAVQNSTYPAYAQGYGVVTFGRPPVSDLSTFRYVPYPAPTRLLDTRNGFGTYRVGPLLPDETRSVAARDLHVAVLNVAVVQPTTNGFVSVYPHGLSYPGATATLNVQAGVTRSNLVIVPFGSGALDIYSQAGGHVVVDVVGQMESESEFSQAPSTGGGRYRAVAATRVLDSQSCLGLAPCSGSPLQADSFTSIDFRNLDVPGLAPGAIPPDAIAVALSMTVDQPAASGYLAAIPGDSGDTSTSTLNYSAGLSATSMAIIRIDGAAAGVGKLFLKRSAHLQVDLLGWFTGANPGLIGDTGMYRTIRPRRLFDSRNGGASPLPGGSITAVDTVQPLQRDEVMAVAVNIASAQSAAPGAVELTTEQPTGEHRSLSFPVAGQAISAASLTAVDGNGFNIRPSSTTHAIIDITGYFIGAPPVPDPGSVVRISQRWDGSTAGLGLGSRPAQVVNSGNTVLFFAPVTGIVNPEAPYGHHAYVWSRATNSVVNLPTVGDVILNEAGNRIVYTTTSRLVSEDVDSESDAYISDLDGSNPRLLPLGGQHAYGVLEASDDLTRVVLRSLTGEFVALNVTSGATVTVPWDRSKEHLLSSDATQLFASKVDLQTGDTTIEVRSLVTGAVQTTVLRGAAFRPVLWSADGSTVAGSYVSPISGLAWNALLHLATGEVVRTDIPNSRMAALTTDGTGVVYWDRLWRVRDLSTGIDRTIEATWNGLPVSHRDDVRVAVLSGDGRYVAFTAAATNLLSETVVSQHIYLRDLQV
jgi:hypothetical protein